MIPKRPFDILIPAALACSLLLAACDVDDEDRADKRSDLSEAEAGPDSRTTVPSATDTGVTGGAPPSSLPTPTMTDANILAKLKMMNDMEVAHGTMAREKGRNAEVQALGKMIVDDHTKMIAQGDNLAGQLSLTPEPPRADSTQAIMERTMNLLNNATPQAFDSLFVAMTLEAHQRALNDLATMQSLAQRTELKNHIAAAIPVVQKHYDRAKQIQGSLGGGTTKGSQS